MATENKKILALVAQVSALNGNRFASLTYTSKESGEVARHTLQLGFSYHNCVTNSLAELRGLTFAADIDREAQAALIASFEKTLTAHANGERSEDYTKKDVYVSLVNGLNVSKTDGTFKLFGLSVAKVVLTNGVYREVNSKPLTVAKDKIRRALPIGKFREFALDAATLEAARINGQTIEF